MSRRVERLPAKAKSTRRSGAKGKASTDKSRHGQDAIERLSLELDDARELHAASAAVLEIISSSRGDLDPVFRAILASALRICDAKFGHFLLYDGERFDAVHLHDVPASYRAFWKANGPIRPAPTTALGRIKRTKRVVHIPDLKADEAYIKREPLRVTTVEDAGARSFLGVPMLKRKELVGAIVIYRRQVRPFTDAEIQLLQTFANQAVIAIENARLFNETKAALERQTASAEVLQIISSSPGDLKPVFDQMLAKAMRLCEAQCGFIYQMEQGAMRAMAEIGVPSAFAEYRRNNLHTGGAATPADVMRATRKPAHVHDARDSEPYRSGNPNAVAGVDLGGARTVLYVPMIRNDDIVGVINVYRKEVRPFTQEQISLLENFASQAVIAIENARLFNETREALERQTATSEVLQVISSSSGELDPVFNKMLENATRICGARFGTMTLYEDGGFRTVALYNAPKAYADTQLYKVIRPHPESGLSAVQRTRKPIHIADIRKEPPYVEGNANVRALADLGGARTIIIVPMLRDKELVGTITIYRQEVKPFTDKQTELVSHFANQAVIAIENARLLNELRERTEELSRSLDDLRTAQDRLIQTEKLASLGQLTAGIAHEIKNPLNFVNNFSALSAELVDEMTVVFENPALNEAERRRELDEIRELLKGNLEKVVQHGKRADSIVKNMLLHSREGSGERRSADVNALVDESLSLAYHGARAEKPGFNVTLQRDFDAGAGSIEMFPQEITRALLNLISNGFYAAAKRKSENGNAEFEPTLLATTKNLGSDVEIRIRDNGTGIPSEIREEIFNPFFTTKPAGEGTGLGLSMTHDIVVKQHGGTIRVSTEPGAFTEFIVTLPRPLSS